MKKKKRYIKWKSSNSASEDELLKLFERIIEDIPVDIDSPLYDEVSPKIRTDKQLFFALFPPSIEVCTHFYFISF